MLDFTSALYLGFRHPRSSLASWERLTCGVPAALGVPAESLRAAEELASLQGCERASLATSTLHLFTDLFLALAAPEASIHLDRGAYAIGRWGVERAAARGIATTGFPHHDPEALTRQLRGAAARRRRPIVVADGFCPGCGPAPLRAYHDVVRRYGGRLVIDDTQALGILGRSPGPAAPFGNGGGGSLRRHGLEGPGTVVVASLAKGFGAPIAALSGDADVIELYESRSETRVHCSPPSVAALRAASHALFDNARSGERRRAKLAGLVRRFRAGAADAGFAPSGGMFPVQAVAHGEDAPALHEHLRRRGVQAVLHRDEGGSPKLSFLLTASHEPDDVDAALAALEAAAGAAKGRQRAAGR